MLEDGLWLFPFIETWTQSWRPWARTPAAHCYAEYPASEDYSKLAAQFTQALLWRSFSSLIEDAAHSSRPLYATAHHSADVPVVPQMPFPMQSTLSPDDEAHLTQIKGSMGVEATRFDESFMQRVLAAGFFEFGRPRRTYTREAALGVVRHAIGIVLPLRELSIRSRDQRIALGTYISGSDGSGRHEYARRSSISSQTSQSWQLRFHQGAARAP